jgi:hypothetical protein
MQQASSKPIIGGIERTSGYYVDPVHPTRRFPSVTSIIAGLTPGEALATAAAKVAAHFAIEQHKVIDSLIDSGHGEAALNMIAEAHKREWGTKAQIGTAVHDTTRALILDLPMAEYDPVCEGYLGAFLEWWEFWKPEVLAAEATVVNANVGYAGRLDLIVDIPYWGKTLVDIKTGRVWETVALQTTAYARATEFWLDSLGNKAPMVKCDNAAVLHLNADGTYTFQRIEITDNNWRGFLGALEEWKWRHDTGKRAIGRRMLPNGILHLADSGLPRNVLDELLIAGVTLLPELAARGRVWFAGDKKTGVKGLPGVGAARAKLVDDLLLSEGLTWADAPEIGVAA